MAYIYRHIRLDKNEPFYIGISKSNINYKRAFNTTARNSFWKNIVSKTEYEVEILLESDDYEFIKQKEVEFISLYGRRDLNKGTLVNLTDGGEGTTNVKISEESRERKRQSSMGIKNPFYGKTHSEETKLIISKTNKGRKWTEEERKKERGGENHPQYGKPLSEERKKKISDAHKGKIVSEETREKMSISRTGKVQTREHILNSSKKIINTKTGEIFDCAKDVALIYGWNYKTFLNRLSGNAKNETDFKYLRDNL